MCQEERDLDQWDDGGFHIIAFDNKDAENLKVVGTLLFFITNV